MVRRRNVILGALGAGAGLAAAGCSSPSHAAASGTWQTPGSAAAPVPAADPISLTVSPAAGAAKVSPVDPVTVAVAGGKLTSVTVRRLIRHVSGGSPPTAPGRRGRRAARPGRAARRTLGA